MILVLEHSAARFRSLQAKLAARQSRAKAGRRAWPADNQRDWSLLLGVVEDDAEGRATSRPNAAYPVSKLGSVIAAFSFYRSFCVGEYDAFAGFERNGVTT